MALLYSVKRVSFCSRFMLILQRRSKKAGNTDGQSRLCQNVGSSLSCNCLECLIQKVLVSAPII